MCRFSNMRFAGLKDANITESYDDEIRDGTKANNTFGMNAE